MQRYEFSLLYFVCNFHFILAIKRHQQSLSPCECGGGSVLLKWLMKAKWPLFLCLAMNLGLTVFTHKGTVVYCSIKSPCSNFLDGQQRIWHFLTCTYLKPFWSQRFCYLQTKAYSADQVTSRLPFWSSAKGKNRVLKITRQQTSSKLFWGFTSWLFLSAKQLWNSRWAFSEAYPVTSWLRATISLP